MKQHSYRFRRISTVAALLILLMAPMGSQVYASSGPLLVIDQIRITTDEQFVRIHNAGDADADLSGYELVYFNSSNAPTKTFTFTGSIDSDGYYIMNDGELNACYQAEINSTSLGFSTASGSLQLWHYNTAKTAKNLESSVAWIKNNKTAAPAGVQMLPLAATAFLQRQWPADTWQGVQPKADDPCALVLTTSPITPAPDETVHLAEGTVPPVNIVSIDENYVAPKNINMIAPVINELLPNPGTPKTDADDEFVELYNPNDTAFDLGGYKFLYGSATPRSYTFPEGTSLAPKSYTAFFSIDTSVSLSNTSGQAWLTDSAGTVISKTEPYGTAKDNQAWALANGKWVWMAKGTPNAANNGAVVIPSTSKSGSASVKSTPVKGSVKGAATTSASGSVVPAELEDAAPVHPLILVGIGLAAVGYAIYEYRHDFANQLFKFKRHLRNRTATRAKV